MKSNAQLRHEGQDEAPQPPPIHIEMPTVASSSQTAPPPPQSDSVFGTDSSFSRITSRRYELDAAGGSFY
jgi:hypothetical protein